MKKEIVYNPEFKIGSDAHCRCIEDVNKAGIRFYKYADEIIRLSHTGWYADNYQDETVRGAVFQLPSRKGKRVFVAGFYDPYNGDPMVTISFDATDCKTTSAQWANSLAERYAEDAREDDAKQTAEMEQDSLLSENVDLRRECLVIFAQAKEIAKTLNQYPAICETLRAHILKNKRDIEANRERIEALKIDYWLAVS